ncbi:MAG: DUF3343 domain-containing protein [Spirochaetaceae bacterium]|jgi:hypothetical protein|nr:DUF3343 domain-containing protein [Spirochaetaceae bacterium]
MKDEAIICFESVSRAILAEKTLCENGFLVRIMPAPEAAQKGCGFCLRLSPQDAEKAAESLRLLCGFNIKEIYLMKESPAGTVYEKINLNKNAL